MEKALSNNFDQDRVRALTAVSRDLLTLRRIGVEVGSRVAGGGGIPGLTVTRARSLIKDPVAFSVELLRWADRKGVELKAEEISAFLEAKLTPEKVTQRGFVPTRYY